MPVKPEREYRMSAPMVPTDDTSYIVEGYAATFDDPYVLYECDGIQYREQIDRNALAEADLSDVILQYDHEGRVYARRSNGTLEISIDRHGLFVRADLSKTEGARRLYEDIKTGMVHQMSWAFVVSADEYDRDTHIRTITKVKKVYDVSAVSFPANPNTTISARSWVDGVIEQEKQELLAAEARRKKIKTIRLKLEMMNNDRN